MPMLQMNSNAKQPTFGLYVQPQKWRTWHPSGVDVSDHRAEILDLLGLSLLFALLALPFCVDFSPLLHLQISLINVALLLITSALCIIIYGYTMFIYNDLITNVPIVYSIFGFHFFNFFYELSSVFFEGPHKIIFALPSLYHATTMYYKINDLRARAQEKKLNPTTDIFYIIIH